MKKILTVTLLGLALTGCQNNSSDTNQDAKIQELEEKIELLSKNTNNEEPKSTEDLTKNQKDEKVIESKNTSETIKEVRQAEQKTVKVDKAIFLGKWKSVKKEAGNYSFIEITYTKEDGISVYSYQQNEEEFGIGASNGKIQNNHLIFKGDDYFSGMDLTISNNILTDNDGFSKTEYKK